MSKKTADPDQHARFLETARALGCDEDEAAFDEKLKAITKPKAEEGGSSGHLHSLNARKRS